MLKITEWTEEDKSNRFVLMGFIDVDSGTITIGDECNPCIRTSTTYGDGTYPVVLTDDNRIVIDLDPVDSGIRTSAMSYPKIQYSDEHSVMESVKGTIEMLEGRTRRFVPLDFD